MSTTEADYPGFHVFNTHSYKDVEYLRYPDEDLNGKSLAEVLQDLRENYGMGGDVFVIRDHGFFVKGQA